MRTSIRVALLLAMPVVASAQRRCTESRTPDPLPMPMQLLDSMALATALGGTAVPPTTFSLWYATGGQLTHVLALADSTVAGEAAPPDTGAIARSHLAAAISAAAFPIDSGGNVTLRLTVSHDSAGALHLSLARSIDCTPELIRTDAPRVGTIETHIVAVPAGGSVPMYAPPNPVGVERRASARVSVDASGRAGSVRLVSSSGNDAVDEGLQEALRAGTYRAGTVDGFPKAMSLDVSSDAAALRR